MSTRALIGITVDCNSKAVVQRDVTIAPAYSEYKLPQSYAQSIDKAGGLPVMLPYRVDRSLIPQYLDQLDGVLLAGGDDLDPSLYGEDWHPSAQRIDPARQVFEFALLDEIERRAMPVLGVCLGSQVMNVHRGGSLIQFLPDELGPDGFDHRLNADWSRRHDIELHPDSRLARSLGKTKLSVNTSHKQAVRTPGRGLRVIATSTDGVIEGLEDPSLPFFMGVQWHPERQNDEADQLRIFQLLVERAGAK
jgi:putative glutamine amidotransferase